MVDSATTTEGVTVAPTVLPSGASAIVWKFTNPIPTNEFGVLAYRAQPPSPTPILTDLGIVKTGPRSAKPGADILYYLRVTNYNTTTIATNVVITDRLPVNATYVIGGDFDPEKRIVQWDGLRITPSTTITQLLVIRAAETIVNADYGVKAEGDEWIKGYPPVTTIVGEHVLLPPVTTTETIINEGAFITWQGITTNMRSNPTYNPGYTIYLPLLWR